MARSFLLAALAAACALSVAAVGGDARTNARAARRAGAQRLRLSEQEAASTSCYNFPENYGTVSVSMSGVATSLGNVGAYASQSNVASGSTITAAYVNSQYGGPTTAESYLMPSPVPTSPSGSCTAPTSSTFTATQQLWNVLGKTLSFTVDLSSAGCGCNAAFCACGARSLERFRARLRVPPRARRPAKFLASYQLTHAAPLPTLYAAADFVQMPGFSSSGAIVPGPNYDGYCDAQGYPSYCPETDIFEANTAGAQFTAHGCTATTNAATGTTSYSSCDSGGYNSNPTCGTTTAYGPGSTYTIDTTKSFTVSTSFPVDSSGSLTDMQTTLTQGSNSLSYSLAKSGRAGSYSLATTLASTTAAFKLGMVPVVSFWGKSSGEMSWLDTFNSQNLCQACASCAVDSKAVFSNISLGPLATAASSFVAACPTSNQATSCSTSSVSARKSRYVKGGKKAASK